MTKLGRSRTATWVALVLAVVLAGACGSTMNVAGDARVDSLEGVLETSPAGDATELDASTSPGAQADAAATSSTPSGAGTGAGAARSGTTRRAAGGSSGAGPAASSGGAGAPVTAGELKLGFVYTINWDVGVNAVFGANPSDENATPSGDQFKAMHQALIDDINAKGGILGRKIVPVWFAYDIFSTQSTEVQDQAACSTFTEDNKVFAAFLAVNYSEVVLNCLERAGVLAIAPFDGKSMEDQQIYDRYPHYIGANLSLNRMASAYVNGLADQGFFGSAARIGLAVTDSPAYIRASDQALKPALARRGLTVTEEVRVNRVHGVNEFSDGAASVQNAVIRFRAAGVTHVLFMAGPGTTLLWFQQARAQSYRPRVGLSTQDWFIGGEPEEMQGGGGAMGVSWRPAGDVLQPPPNPLADKCHALMKAKNGRTFKAWAPTHCDQVWTFADGATAGGSPLTIDSVVAGFEKVGVKDHAGLLRTRYTASQRDGIAQAAPVKWFADCECWRYTGAPKDL